jgi:hypothetical protein
MVAKSADEARAAAIARAAASKTNSTVYKSADAARAAATAPGASAKAAATARAAMAADAAAKKASTTKKKTTKPPVKNAGVFPLTGQSWNEIGFNEGVFPLTGPAWAIPGGTNTNNATTIFGNPNASPAGIPGGGNSSASSDTTDTNVAPTNNIDVLKATLRSLGFTSAILDSSTSFLNSLIKEGLDYDNAVEIFLNTKEYTLKNGTKISSPFYTEYGYLNEGLVTPKSASELFNFVEGTKEVVDKYKLSSKYLSSDSLKLYVKNGITVTNIAQRAAMAELRALEADPFQTDALIKQGYIGSAADLKDFFLDPKIGQEQLELNKQTGVFTAEALRRAKSGVLTDSAQLAKFKQLTASLAAKGYSEGQIANYAAEGFENIAQDINPLTSLAQIYEKAGGTVASNAALASNIQSDLLAQEFQGTASERRKRLSAQGRAAFQGSAGTGSTSLRTAGTSGLL